MLGLFVAWPKRLIYIGVIAWGYICIDDAYGVNLFLFFVFFVIVGWDSCCRGYRWPRDPFPPRPWGNYSLSILWKWEKRKDYPLFMWLETWSFVQICGRTMHVIVCFCNAILMGVVYLALWNNSQWYVTLMTIFYLISKNICWKITEVNAWAYLYLIWYERMHYIKWCSRLHDSSGLA